MGWRRDLTVKLNIFIMFSQKCGADEGSIFILPCWFLVIKECFEIVVSIRPMLDWKWRDNLGAYCNKPAISDYIVLGWVYKEHVKTIKLMVIVDPDKKIPTENGSCWLTGFKIFKQSLAVFSTQDPVTQSAPQGEA